MGAARQSQDPALRLVTESAASVFLGECRQLEYNTRTRQRGFAAHRGPRKHRTANRHLRAEPMKISVISLAALLTPMAAVSVARAEPAGSLNPADTIDPSSISYVIVSTETSEIVEANWKRLDDPLPVGSLIKPFTALAYAESHAFRYPEVRCRGAEDECWLPKGHGTLGVQSALAQSCNTYFLWLADRVLCVRRGDRCAALRPGAASHGCSGQCVYRPRRCMEAAAAGAAAGLPRTGQQIRPPGHRAIGPRAGVGFSKRHRQRYRKGA